MKEKSEELASIKEEIDDVEEEILDIEDELEETHDAKERKELEDMEENLIEMEEDLIEEEDEVKEELKEEVGERMTLILGIQYRMDVLILGIPYTYVDILIIDIDTLKLDLCRYTRNDFRYK